MSCPVLFGIQLPIQLTALARYIATQLRMYTIRHARTSCPAFNSSNSLLPTLHELDKKNTAVKRVATSHLKSGSHSRPQYMSITWTIIYILFIIAALLSSGSLLLISSQVHTLTTPVHVDYLDSTSHLKSGLRLYNT